MQNFILHKKQWLAYLQIADHSISAYCGGIRSGKTIIGCHYALDCILHRPNELGGIFSNTSKQLTKSTLKEFKGVLTSYGLIEGTHYFVNKNPEKKFNYRSRFSDHAGIWSFWTGAQVFTFSLETQIRGVEFGWVLGDEIQNAAIDDLNVVLGRMSGSKDPKTFYCLTPPRNNIDIDELIYGDNHIPVTFGTTYDNSKNLPADYVSMLERTYDRITFAREVMCERITTDGLSWLYSFSRERNVNAQAKYQPAGMVYVSFDFNTNPIVCTLAHRGYYTKEYLETRADLTDDQKKAKLGKRYVHYFDTVLLTPDKMQGKEHIQAIVDVIKEKTPYQWQHKAYIITGDATGRNSNVLARVGATAWSQVIDAFGINIQQVQTPKSNPTHVDARVLCNSFIANYDEVYISPHCKELIQDCEFVKAKPDGHKLKDSRKDETQRADLLDALTYDICTFNKDWIAIKR